MVSFCYFLQSDDYCIQNQFFQLFCGFIFFCRPNLFGHRFSTNFLFLHKNILQFLFESDINKL